MKNNDRFLALILFFCWSCSHTQEPSQDIPLETLRVEDYQYLRDQTFFLDLSYRENYRHYSGDYEHISAPDPIVVGTIEVYDAGPNYDINFPDRSFPAWAIFDYPTTQPPTAGDIGTIIVGAVEFGNFIQLPKEDYLIDPDLGYIKLITPSRVDRILAVNYTSQNGIGFRDTVNGEIVLKLIKPWNPLPSNPSWGLSWKHVYTLGKSKIDKEGFDVKIFQKSITATDRDTDNEGVQWITKFGLDVTDKSGNSNPDGVIDTDGNFINLTLGEIHFPDLSPFDPEGYWIDSEFIVAFPEQFRTPAIYDTTSQSFINAQSKFYLEITTKSMNQ